MKFLLRTALMFTLFPLSVQSQDLEQRIYPITELGVTLMKPAGFESSPEFQGFINLKTASTINVNAVEQAIGLVLMNYSREALAARNMQLINREEVELQNGKKGMMITSTFTVKSGFDFERLTLLTGDHKKTFVVMGNYPVQVKETEASKIRDAMLSIEF